VIENFPSPQPNFFSPFADRTDCILPAVEQLLKGENQVYFLFSTTFTKIMMIRVKGLNWLVSYAQAHHYAHQQLLIVRKFGLVLRFRSMVVRPDIDRNFIQS
jgi:hypothetical protein